MSNAGSSSEKCLQSASESRMIMSYSVSMNSGVLRQPTGTESNHGTTGHVFCRLIAAEINNGTQDVFHAVSYQFFADSAFPEYTIADR